MSDNEKPATGQESSGVNKSRGPAYPYLDLPKAMERVEQMVSRGLSTKHVVPPATVYGYWDMGVKSSASRQTMAGLKYYGLVEYVGTGKDRRIRLTDSAMVLAHDKDHNSKRRASALREAALSPDIFREIYEENGGPHLPPDDSLILSLTLDKGFDKDSAEKAIKNFRSTIGFAGLDQVDSAESLGELNEQPSEKAAGERNTADASIDPPKRQSETPPESHQNNAQYKVDKYATLEGDVTFTWPISLSLDSLDEVEDWLKLIMKKLKREIARRSPPTSTEQPDDDDSPDPIDSLL